MKFGKFMHYATHMHTLIEAYRSSSNLLSLVKFI